jgi:hypothetical protein
MPYNPGIQDVSGQLIGQGFSRAGEGIARGLERYGEAQLEAKRQGALAAGLRKIAPLIRRSDGSELISKEEAATMSATELGSLLQNYSVQTALEMNQQQIAMAREKMKEYAGREKFSKEMGQRMAPQPVQLPPALRPPPLPDLAGQLASPLLPGETPPLANYAGQTIPGPNPPLPPASEVLALAAQHGIATPEMALSMQPDPLKTINAQTAFQNAQTAGMNAQTARMRLEQGAREKETAANHPWIFTEDTNELVRGLEQLDPQERDRVIALRTAYNRMTGRNDPLAEALAMMLTGGRGASKDKPAPAPKVRKWNPDTGRIE